MCKICVVGPKGKHVSPRGYVNRFRRGQVGQLLYGPKGPTYKPEGLNKFCLCLMGQLLYGPEGPTFVFAWARGAIW